MPSASSCLTLNLAGREKVEIQNVRYDEEGHMILDEQNAGDLLRVFQALHTVTNNTPRSVGGGGTPRTGPR